MTTDQLRDYLTQQLASGWSVDVVYTTFGVKSTCLKLCLEKNCEYKEKKIYFTDFPPIREMLKA